MNSFFFSSKSRKANLEISKSLHFKENLRTVARGAIFQLQRSKQKREEKKSERIAQNQKKSSSNLKS